MTAEKNNRIWIELDNPDDFEDAKLQCELANSMLSRLGIDLAITKFWAQRGFFSEDRSIARHPYALTTNSAGSYVELCDNGQWFNLDFLAGSQ